MPAEIEVDDLDPLCIHAAAYREGKCVGTGRLSPDGKIGRMAVLQEWRGCGIGNALMACLLDRAVSLDISRLQLSAQYHAIGFYKQFGFEPIGSVYEEAGIDHIRMVKDLNA